MTEASRPSTVSASKSGRKRKSYEDESEIPSAAEDGNSIETKTAKKPRQSTKGKGKSKAKGEEEWPEYFQHVGPLALGDDDVATHACALLSLFIQLFKV